MATQTQTQREKEREHRQLMSKLRSLKGEATNQPDLSNPESRSLQAAASKLDDLSNQITIPREQALDSEIFCGITEKGVEMAKKMRSGTQGQCPGDVIRRLRAIFLTSEYAPDEQIDPNDFDWAALSQLASHHFCSAPGVACMLGPMNAEVKARKVPQQRAKKQPPGQLQTTQKVDVATEKDKDVKETDANMEEMWTVLKSVQEADFLELCVNHTSFAQTVENVFALSFLVRDGRVKLMASAHGSLRVKALGSGALAQKDGANASTSGRETDGERVQAILGFEMADWRWFREFVRPEDCLMKPRKEGWHDNAAAGGSSPGSQSGGENNDPNEVREAVGRSSKILPARPQSLDAASRDEEGSDFPLQRGGSGSAKRRRR
ncbi:hypothetical protein WJX74_004834 [Apatococcus lobatus]|uniref:Non-structural maintenance of chromosomes element 4 n=1 Tax=Apatococcus lobatus TaxID=904363 RepID=A0AAW1SDR8_9CHLO